MIGGRFILYRGTLKMTTVKNICSIDFNNFLGPELISLIETRCRLTIDIANNEQQLIQYCEKSDPSLIILTLNTINTTIKNIIIKCKKRFGHIPIFCIIEEVATLDDLDELLNLGADDFILMPIQELVLITRIRQKLEYNYSKSVDKTRISLVSKFGMSKLVGADPSFTASINRLHKISKINAPVLIIGETGTGKELFARAIHYTSNREKKPYIPVNCGSIPVELFENELFGHIKGAYTDAKANQKGFIAEAEGGTLFLDEINSMPFAAQVKLLRFLQERQYKPLGSSKYVPADVRIIAASNINLMDAEITDKFRKDLLYRLSVFTIFVPPLRNRKSDIPILANYFLEKYSELYNLPQKTLSKKAIDKLISYNWPGNVRELENIIQQCLVESKTSIIDPDEILIRKGLNAAIDNNNSETDTKKNMFERFEKDYLKDLLIESKGNVSAAARKANISRNHFYRLMRKYNIGREDL